MSVQSNSTAEQGATSVSLSPQIFEELVSRVTAEVTKVITPLVNPPRPTATQPASLANLMLPSSSDVISVQRDELNEEPLVPTAITHQPPVGQLITSSIGFINNTLQGERHKPSAMFHSVGLSLDACIPEKVRTKIISNEFIDFGVLISNHIQADNKYHISIVNGKGDQPSLCLEPSNKPKKKVNIEDWRSAFRIFVAVYTRKYTTEAPALMKYGDLIQDLASRSHNWRFYDENFRILRHANLRPFPGILFTGSYGFVLKGTRGTM